MKNSKTPHNSLPKLISFVGRSNSGKTTLLTKLVPVFHQMGLEVGVIKNTHHDVEFDKPGKDSWKYAQSGCSRVLVSSGSKLAVFAKQPTPLPLRDLASQWFQGFDLVISEGFKNEESFKIEVIRKENRKTPLFHDPSYKINAVVGDIEPLTTIPFFSFDELQALVKWICDQLEIPTTI